MSVRVIIVTGEVSGDIYGSRLADGIRTLVPGVVMSGVGGDRMRQAGVEVFLDSSDLSVVGFWEAITRLGRLRSALDQAKRHIADVEPDLLVLIDYPGMNLRLARFAKEKGFKVMYYISPQVWAWGRNRVNLIRRSVDKMVVILPFEVDIYKEAGIDVTYVGHPLIDIVKADLDRRTFLDMYGLNGDRSLVGLLPGSRMQEIRQHVGPLVETAALLRERLPSVDFILVTLDSFEGIVRAEVEKSGQPIAVTTVHKYEALKYSDLALTCSGTVTLEAALLGTPIIVIYKLALFSWALGRLIVKVPYISLVNLVAEQKIVPEFIQDQVSPKALADEAVSILTDDGRRSTMRQQIELVKARLGSPGATERAARVAVSLLGM